MWVFEAQVTMVKVHRMGKCESNSDSHGATVRQCRRLDGTPIGLSHVRGHHRPDQEHVSMFEVTPTTNASSHETSTADQGAVNRSAPATGSGTGGIFRVPLLRPSAEARTWPAQCHGNPSRPRVINANTLEVAARKVRIQNKNTSFSQP